MAARVESRSGLARAAGLLLAGMAVMLVDVRLDELDVVPDAIGGVLMLLGILEASGAIEGADDVKNVLLVLALVGLVASVLDTLSVDNVLAGALAIAQPLGALLLARLLAGVLSPAEASLAASWRLTSVLVLWLGLVPWLVGTVVGYVVGPVRMETPLVIPILIVVSIPYISLVISLFRTTSSPPVAGSSS